MTAISRITPSALLLLAGLAQAHGDPIEPRIKDPVQFIIHQGGVDPLATLRRESAGADDDEMSAIMADNEAKTRRFVIGRQVLGYETIAVASKR